VTYWLHVYPQSPLESVESQINQ